MQVVYWVVLWESAPNDPLRNSGAGMAVGRVASWAGWLPLAKDSEQ